MGATPLPRPGSRHRRRPSTRSPPACATAASATRWQAARPSVSSATCGGPAPPTSRPSTCSLEWRWRRAGWVATCACDLPAALVDLMVVPMGLDEVEGSAPRGGGCFCSEDPPRGSGEGGDAGDPGRLDARAPRWHRPRSGPPLSACTGRRRTACATTALSPTSDLLLLQRMAMPCVWSQVVRRQHQVVPAAAPPASPAKSVGGADGEWSQGAHARFSSIGAPPSSPSVRAETDARARRALLTEATVVPSSPPLGGMPVQHLAQDEDRPPPRREVLERFTKASRSTHAASARSAGSSLPVDTPSTRSSGIGSTQVASGRAAGSGRSGRLRLAQGGPSASRASGGP